MAARSPPSHLGPRFGHMPLDKITTPVVAQFRADLVAKELSDNGQSYADGSLGEDELTWLARRADGGFGLVSTCATYVALDGKGWDGEIGIESDARLPGLARLAARLHRGGAAAIVQLFHGGVRAT